MKRYISYRVDYSYLDRKDGRQHSFIDILHTSAPSEPLIKNEISNRWQRQGYTGSSKDSIVIENVESARS